MADIFHSITRTWQPTIFTTLHATVLASTNPAREFQLFCLKPPYLVLNSDPLGATRILNLINKTEIINLKMNSRLEITLLSECHKAALWNLYGHK